ncbi:MAG: hypothetical protein FD138_3310 [Planctomycetota bacterium]|nr:MAG: hypothetical protein FD138_3310 [Planctomycetota bacterium]
MKMSEAEFERQYLEATKRGEEKRRTHPWAVAVKYDRRSSRLIVALNKGTILSVPTALVPELKGLKPNDLAKVTVLGPGYDLDWEHLDIQVSVAWLLTGMYGDAPSLSVIGRKGGSATSAAKAIAARMNGAKGGRPRKKRKTATA